VLVWITSGLVLFRWVTPPLQPRVVGPYLEWGAWLSSRMSLEGTGRIQIWAVTSDPQYLGYKTLTQLPMTLDMLELL
jgi:hypothetical protein